MGDDPERDENVNESEKTLHRLTLPTYYMTRLPVTVTQFRAFVEQSDSPRDKACLKGKPNHPVVFISWHDAVEYCMWLTKQLKEWEGTPEPIAELLREKGWEVTLPTEAEWEKASRGESGNLYPWGNIFDFNRANLGETGIGGTSAVGCFPTGASTYGVLDMSGNVWEWCDGTKESYPYKPDDGQRGPGKIWFTSGTG